VDVVGLEAGIEEEGLFLRLKDFGSCRKIFPTDGLVEFFNAWFECRQVAGVLATGQEGGEGEAEEGEKGRAREGEIFHYRQQPFKFIVG